MTDAELSEISARAEAATPGPWEDGCDEKFHVVVQGTEEKIATMRVKFDREQNCYNAIFIAHARTDIPALLAHIDELKTALANEEAESFALGIEIMLGEQIWTTKPPKESGNYWWKCEQESSGEPQMVNVRITEGRFHFFFHYSEGPCLHTCEQCRWAGPIPMPKEPAP